MTSDPPPEFVHDTAHLLRALEKEGLVETRVGPDGQLQYSDGEAHEESLQAGRRGSRGRA